MRANEEALRATNLDCLGRATKIHGDIFVSNAYRCISVDDCAQTEILVCAFGADSGRGTCMHMYMSYRHGAP